VIGLLTVRTADCTGLLLELQRVSLAAANDDAYPAPPIAKTIIGRFRSWIKNVVNVAEYRM